MKKITLLIILLSLTFVTAFSQIDSMEVVDKIIARVGDEIILQSEIEAQYLQMRQQKMTGGMENPRCVILENMLMHKMLINQADIDSIYVTSDEVESELTMRLQTFTEQAGGEEQLENYLGKSIFEIKSDMQKTLKEQMRASRVQMTLTEDVEITPSEVNIFYENLDTDSVPIVDETIEIQKITIKPILSKSEEQKNTDKMLAWKQQIENGEKQFETIALVYSNDESSAGNGGQLPFMARGELVPEYAAAAFKLKKGEISGVVKTDFGFHLIRLDERKGERIKTSHILITPKTSGKARENAEKKLDSIRTLILLDTISFDDAALKFSDDEDTKKNNGLVFNPQTGSTRIEVSMLPRNIKQELDKVKEGEITKVLTERDNLGNVIYTIYRVNSRTKSHLANVGTDYQLIYNMALNAKKQEIIDDWITEKQKTTYIKIDDKYKNCDFESKGWLK